MKVTREFDEFDVEREKTVAERWHRYKEDEVTGAILSRRDNSASAYKKF